ncbi:hypothetical protein RclHR1_21620002 [Rhizophagus clarus]|uniref:Uncharacterized protein n=1 Tax=Rhizophagus clarus TaxID=94130 RepID=A0A2Z6R6K7_9GLOM|nr:hypothetical protein RclHR1_21620002 [Rhizophagus clarus]
MQWMEYSSYMLRRHGWCGASVTSGDKLMVDPELKEKLDDVNKEKDRRIKEKPPVEKSNSDNSNGSD